MSIDFERELRTEMEQAPIRPRPDVVQAAYRRFRLRRLATRAALAAGTTVVAVVAITVAVTGLPGQQRIETAAYVVSQMSSALAAASGDIMYIRQDDIDAQGSTPDPVGIQYWAHASQSREMTTSGGVEQDEWDTVTPDKQGVEDAVVSVDYQQRTVVKSATIFPHVPRQPGIDCHGIPGGLIDAPGTGLIENASWLAGYLRTMVGCGGVTTAWNQRLDGTEAIELTGHFGSSTWHVWIDEATFLPIADGYSGPATRGSTSERYAWLAPTAANLATLTGPVPPGFAAAN